MQESELVAWLRGQRITEVECVIADMTGIARGKIMPAGKFLNEFELRLPESVMLQTVTGDYVDDETYYALLDPKDIDMVLKPDPNALFMVPWALEPVALIIHDVFDRDGNPYEMAPRNVLKKVLKLYQDKGWQPVVAPELEFYLVQRSDDPDLPFKPPIGRSGRPETGRASFSIDAANEYDPLFEDVYDWCEAQNLDIDTLIHEEGVAQMEINFRHGDPLHLADQVFVFKRTVREAALKHNVSATFMAKPIKGEPGSSMHIHQSVVDVTSGQNLFSNADGSASALFRHFIGGMQKYLFDVIPLFAPNVNSYRRFLPDSSAPINAEWGEDNRTCAFRVPDSGPENRRLENRLPGADANPYLALAASLLCGYLGMAQAITPRPPAKGRANVGRDLGLPASLEQAIARFEVAEHLKAHLGERFILAYAELKRVENENYKQVISSWERQFLEMTV
ncbi:glutamine synthetase family protein [Gallaecimonas mangrovi]|uniref:glutamine synthetase family protein n=1 Tax=Gallaecimonas mangrovi TaxID=2291597 RepID=UPI000E200A58|nr:glutamine synthetase family protein [Gallaecimonas mangrovi]